MESTAEEPMQAEASGDVSGDLNAPRSMSDAMNEGATSADSNNVHNHDAVEMTLKMDDSDMSINEKKEQQTNEHLQSLCVEKDLYITQLQKQLEDAKQSNTKLSQQAERASFLEKKLKQQQLESSRKENILIMRLTLKEQELQDCLAQIEALKQLRLPTNTQLESYLLDPTLNYMFEQMKKEVDSAKSRAEEMQSELNAWKFTTDSVTGKRLMSKCRQLHQENEELGKMISSGKIAKLEGGLAMSKKYSEELKKSQSEIEEVLMEMEEDMEGLQNTVYFLQQQLKEQKEKNTELEESLVKYRAELGEQQLQPAPDTACSQTETIESTELNGVDQNQISPVISQ